MLAGLGADHHRGLSSDGVPSSISVHGYQDPFEHYLPSPSSPMTEMEDSAVSVYHPKGGFVEQPPGSGGGAGGERPQYDSSAYAASLDDRRGVYGPNAIPARKSKSLLQLMWLALTDRVLVGVP